MRKTTRMSVHYKFVLDKRRKRADQIYPLKLRIYDSDGNKEKSLDIAIHEAHWDDAAQVILPADPNYKANSFKLNSVKTKIERRVLLAEDEEDALMPEAIIATMTKQRVAKSTITLKEYADSLIADMFKAGRAGNAMAYQDALNSLLKFTGDDRTKFEAITYKQLYKYNTHMLSKGVKVNTVAAYLRSIRAIYNKAIKAEVIDSKVYPFAKFTIETEDTISRALTLQEMQQIVKLPIPPNTPMWHNRNYFLLSFCLIGINFADLFTLESGNVRDNRIAYRRNKTGRIYNIGLNKYTQDLLLKCSSAVSSRSANQYLLPQLRYAPGTEQERKDIKQLCKTCGKYMKLIAQACGINKRITTYYARYTWANLAKKELGYSNDLIADALGHQYGNKVTGIYLDNYCSETIDEANRAVIDLVFGN